MTTVGSPPVTAAAFAAVAVASATSTIAIAIAAFAAVVAPATIFEVAVIGLFHVGDVQEPVAAEAKIDESGQQRLTESGPRVQ